MQKYRIIENIDQSNGVTPEQLIDQCHYLITTIKGSYLITEEEDRATIIHDVVTKVYGKMKLDLVNKFVYKEFKGYLYISLTNGIRAFFRDRNVVALNIEDIAEYNFVDSSIDKYNDDDNDILNKKKFKSLIENLSPIKKQFINEILEGANSRELELKYNLGKGFYFQLKRELIRKLNPNKKVKKMPKFKINRNPALRQTKLLHLLIEAYPANINKHENSTLYRQYMNINRMFIKRKTDIEKVKYLKKKDVDIKIVKQVVDDAELIEKIYFT